MSSRIPDHLWETATELRRKGWTYAEIYDETGIGLRSLAKRFGTPRGVKGKQIDGAVTFRVEDVADRKEPSAMSTTPADPRQKIDEFIDVLTEMLVSAVRWKQALEDQATTLSPSGAAASRNAGRLPGG